MEYAHNISQNNSKWNAPQWTERSAGLGCILFVYFLMLENDWSFCPAYIARNKAVILPEDPVITFWLKTVKN